MAFPPILVINLDDRNDRWIEIQKSFKEWPLLERVSAIKESPGWKGCLKSHLKAIKIAKERNYEWVLVLEDDCVVKHDSLERFKNLLPILFNRKEEYDVFLGGCTVLDDAIIMQYYPPIFKIKAYTTHFCLYHSKSYDKLLLNPSSISENDLKPIDVIFKDSFRLFCTTPHIAIQKEGVSDIENKEINYDDLFVSSDNTLSKLMNTESQLEGFLQDCKIYNNKITLLNIIIITTLFIFAKRFI